jgi:hypothetical protein
MSSSTFASRKKAMAFVYEAKVLVPNLPRINIRITENLDGIMGAGRAGTCTVWLTDETINSKRLKEIVFHEIVHAAFGLSHYKGCKLMDANASLNPTDIEMDNLLIHYSTMAKH